MLPIGFPYLRNYFRENKYQKINGKARAAARQTVIWNLQPVVNLLGYYATAAE